jgi:hypothetical protein
MSFSDPIAAYNAVSNLEAHLVANALREAGLEAIVIEDLSLLQDAIGFATEVHKVQVWIERAETDRAKPVLEEYERQAAERQKTAADAPLIEVICEECGATTLFPANQLGSVQNCPRCRAFVDVGDDVPFDGWDEVSADEHAKDD